MVPVLQYYDPTLLVIVEMDARYFAIGVVLSQKDGRD
jgi:hypothetical protein